MKSGRESHGCWEEYSVYKRERGSNIIFPLMLRLRGRILSGKEDGNFGDEKKRFKERELGKNIKL